MTFDVKSVKIAYKYLLKRMGYEYPTEIELTRYLSNFHNWAKAIDDPHLYGLYAYEYPVYGISDKPVGKIDYIFSYHRSLYITECKITPNKNDLMHNMSSLKVLGYRELYCYDKGISGANKKYIRSAILITNKSLTYNMVYICGYLKIAIFLLYPDNLISTILNGKIQSSKINEIMNSEKPVSKIRHKPVYTELDFAV